MKKLLWIIPIVVVFAIAYYFLYGKEQSFIVGDCCPNATIYLQPYDNYTQKEANQLSKVLEQKFKELFGVEFEVEVLPNKTFTTELTTIYRRKAIIYREGQF